MKLFTLNTQHMTRADLRDSVEGYPPGARDPRKATWSPENPDGRWRSYTYEELLERDKLRLDLFWLRDESLEDSANLPEPHVLAQEIAEDLRASLEQIEEILSDLMERVK